MNTQSKVPAPVKPLLPYQRKELEREQRLEKTTKQGRERFAHGRDKVGKIIADESGSRFYTFLEDGSIRRVKNPEIV